MAQHLRALSCKILGHEAFDKETRTLEPWNWGEFKGYSTAAFAHDHCVRCNALLKDSNNN